jgi:hypothetical protein
VTVLAAATAAVVVAAVTATGIPVNKVSANDGTVWVVNDMAPGLFGQFNVPIRQLTAVVPDRATLAPNYQLDVRQQGTTVLAIDEGQHKVVPVDVATGGANMAGGIAFGPGGRIALGGGVAALLQPATGRPAPIFATNVGAGQEANIGSLNPVTAKPLATLPGGEAVAVDETGDVFAASPAALLEIPAVGPGFGPARTFPLRNGPLSAGAVALTTVGSVPVVMDTTASKPVVLMPLTGTTTTIPPATPQGQGTTFALQQPGPASASVLVDTPTQLLSVGLGGGPPQVLASTSGPGAPAQPVDLDGCAFGAWGGSPGSRAEACPGTAPSVAPLLDEAGHTTVSGDLVYRVNNGQILLNDDADGAAWTIKGAVSQVLQNQQWQTAYQGLNAKANPNANNRATASEVPHRKPPVLHNPTLYARSGVQSTLHVLDGDTDPGGSIMSILNVTVSGPGFQAAVSPDNQSVVLTLAQNAVAPITLQYEVIDGYGLTSSGPVTVEPTTVEHPPTPPANPSPLRHVVAGGTVSLQVLGGWRDPENDAVILSNASVPAGDGTVSWTSDGLITYSAPGDNSSDKPVTLNYSVSDGRSAPVPSQIPLEILGRGDLQPWAPAAVPDAVKVTIGRPTTFSPLANDIFGADPIHPGAALGLAAPVSGLAGLSVATNVNSGEVTFTASNEGTYLLSYEASYGSGVSPATQILVEAVRPPSTNLPPVTTPLSMLIHGQYPATVDVLTSDYDPSGGLLSVVGVNAPTGLQATIVDGEFIRVVATTPNSPPTQVITYQVSNGASAAVTGQVTVYWQPPIEPPLPPVVPPIYAAVRAGDEVDLPVLAAASDPDGEQVHLLTGGKPNAVTLAPTNPGGTYPTHLGSASIDGSYIRYSAPAEGTGTTALTGAEQVTLSYEVESDTGSRVTGLAYVTVNPTTPSLDTPPAPAEVDARTESGGTVTIPIPTTGVASDGDSGTVTGIVNPPHLGRIMSYTANSVTYQAYPTAAGSVSFAGGTDSFSYTMEGPSGLIAQGVVRVSVTPPTQVQPPVAVDHYITAAPGTTVQVDLLSGDIVAPGDQLTVEPLSSTNTHVPPGAALTGTGGSFLQVTTPTGPEPVDIAYGITDGTAAPSVAHVIVRDQPGFALAPFASDYFPTAPAAGSQTVNVDVLAKDSDPAGGTVVLVGSPEATVDPGNSAQLDIPVSRYPHNVPYEIRSTKTDAVAVGVVHVPGAATGPQLKPGSVIQVPAGGSKSVHVPDYITDPTHAIRLTTVQAQQVSPTGGLSVAVTSNTDVTLTASPSYSGPGSLTVQVIDAQNLSTPGAVIATFTIPVQVGTPSPIVRCPSDPLKVVESGPPVDANIAGICQVWTPTGASPNTLTYTESWSKSVPGVSLGWAPGRTGQVVRVTAASSAVGGAVGTITVGVAGSSPRGFSTLQVQAVEAGPASIAAINVHGVQTNHKATIDVAQYVTSPLSKPDIVVIKVGSPSQGSADVTSSGSQVVITPHPGVHGVVTFPIQVSDQGTNRPDRVITGQITLQVLDNPGVATGLTGVPGNKQVKLSWNPAPDNGSPIEYYNLTEGGTTVQVPGTSYTWTSGLQNGQNYTFTLTAVNLVGPSPQSVPGTFEPNSIPDAPTNVVAQGFDRRATISWTAPFNGGKAIDRYIISISPSVGTSTEYAPGTATSYDWTGLVNTTGPYTFTVVAHNADGAGPTSAPSNKVAAHGTPPTPSAPTASGKVSADQTTTTVTVTWPATTACNDPQACASYTVTELSGGSTVGTDTVTASQCSGSTCSAIFGPITDNGAGYTYQLRQKNQEGDVSAASPQSAPVVYAVGYPGQITDLSVSPENTAVSATFTLPPSHGASISKVDYYLNGSASPNGSWSNPGSSGQKVTEQISGLTNGTNYSVQVSACSQSSGGTSGGCGPLSNASTAVPYGPPNPPSVSASASGNNITFSWGGGGNNGRPVASYHVCFDSSCSTYSSGGSNTIGYGCQQTHTITAYVIDTAGQQSGTASANATTGTCTPSDPATANGNAFATAKAGGFVYAGEVVNGTTYSINGACFTSNDIPSNNGWWYRNAATGHWMAATLFQDKTNQFNAPRVFGGGSSNCN